MSSKLQKQLKMNKPFDSIETEVFLNLSRTHSVLASNADAVFKSSGITAIQYNVLRILRGAGDAGLPSLEIAERMVTRVPDITRLVDRLIKLELVSRRRCDNDRRVVYVLITKQGKDVLRKLDSTVKNKNLERFKHMSTKKLKLLNDLLVEARNEE